MTSLVIGIVSGIPLSLYSVKKRVIDGNAAILSIIFSGLYFMTGTGVFLTALFFFASSSLLTRYKWELKASGNLAEPSTGRRWTQVLGAGGVAALLSLLSTTNIFKQQVLIPTITSVLAVSTADTWAAEIGSTSSQDPRLIIKPWIRVDKGLSGGITLRGEISALLGSLSTALLALYLGEMGLMSSIGLREFASIAALGWLGEIIDSIIGASIQAKYYCPVCKKHTDKRIHSCGAKTLLSGGLAIVSNEVTNLLSTGIIAVSGLVLFSLL